MGILSSLKRRVTAAGDPAVEVAGGDVDAALDELARSNREHRDPDLDRRILRLRHRAGMRLVGDGNRDANWAEADYESLPDAGSIPEVSLAELTPEVLRAGILRDGCVLVRGAVPPHEAEALAGGIESALRAREDGSANGAGLYEEFDPEPPYSLDERSWVTGGGGLWAADSPRLAFDMFETYEGAGLPRLIEGYLGERPAISVNKCTLRKVTSEAGRGWHQDGAFMGDVRALNVWLALSRCGSEAPGMDIVARRLEEIAPTGTEGAIFDWSVSEQVARETAGEKPIVRPEFEPGDMLFFDEMLLHTTAAEPGMRRPRYAIETWFFGPSAFPGEYVPLAA
jgi:hypothetical protein